MVLMVGLVNVFMFDVCEILVQIMPNESVKHRNNNSRKVSQ